MSLTFYNRPNFWDNEFGNDALAWPTDNIFSRMPAMRDNALMEKTRKMVAPLESILKVDFITNEDNYEVHAGKLIVFFTLFCSHFSFLYFLSAHFHVDLPGVQKEDLDITMEGQTLIISGERKSQHEDKTDSRHIIERSHGKVSRTLLMPKNANMQTPVPKFENGVLTIVFPKDATIEGGPRKMAIA